MTQNYFFLNSEAKRFPTRGHMPMFEQNLKNGIFGPFLTLFGLFFGPNGSKWPKIIFFLNFEAKRFPTRGHMPMFEQNLKKWYFWSLFDPFWPLKLAEMGPKINFGPNKKFYL